MIKVAWLAQYNIYELLPEIKLIREVTIHSSSWIHTLSEALAKEKEISLHIITHSPLVSHSQTIIKNGIVFHVIKYNFPFTDRGFPEYLPFDKLTGYLSFQRKAAKTIDQIKPDVLHVHGTEGGYFRPALRTRIPCIVSIQGIIAEYIKIEPSLAGHIQVLYERQALQHAKYFGCRTCFDYDFVKSVNRNAVIFNLPEAMNNVFFKQQWRRPDELSLLFVGSINKRKGIEDLLKALAIVREAIPSIVLKIIGTGKVTYTEFLKNEIQQLHLQANVKWLGAKTPLEVAQELQQSTIFVLPTLMDNSPNCVAEAMAVGVPCIATRIGGIPSMITHNENGALFTKNDIRELADLIMILAKDEKLQDLFSANAREVALTRHFPANVAKTYLQVYETLKQ